MCKNHKPATDLRLVIAPSRAYLLLYQSLCWIHTSTCSTRLVRNSVGPVGRVLEAR